MENLQVGCKNVACVDCPVNSTRHRVIVCVLIQVLSVVHCKLSISVFLLQTYLATQAQLQLVEDPMPTKTLRGT